jgi:hypothetical protein
MWWQIWLVFGPDIEAELDLLDREDQVDHVVLECSREGHDVDHHLLREALVVRAR